MSQFNKVCGYLWQPGTLHNDFSYLLWNGWLCCGLKQFQVSYKALFSSGTEFNRCERSASCLPSIFLTYSIEFESREFTGHVMCWIVCFMEVVNQTCTVTRRIMIYEVRTTSTSKQANIRFKNFVSVIFFQSQTSSKVYGDLCGRSTWCLHIPLLPLTENDVFRYVSGLKTNSMFSPYR